MKTPLQQHASPPNQPQFPFFLFLFFLFLIWLFDVSYFLLSGQCENHLCDLKSPGNHNNMRNFSCVEKSDWISGADLEQQQAMRDLFQY